MKTQIPGKRLVAAAVITKQGEGPRGRKKNKQKKISRKREDGGGDEKEERRKDGEAIRNGKMNDFDLCGVDVGYASTSDEEEKGTKTIRIFLLSHSPLERVPKQRPFFLPGA